MGRRLANNKFLFIDHAKTIERQRFQKTLSAPQIAPISEYGARINRLETDAQNHLLQGPFKDRLAD
eukprot:12903984-Prorocentrum_lima.AAC.1